MAKTNLSKLQENFTCLAIVCVDHIKLPLMDILEKHIKPPDLYYEINSSTLISANKLRPDQKKLCYITPPGIPDYSKFDVTLLYTLIRNLCPSLKPSGRWGEEPAASYTQLGDDIERLRRFRNEQFAHANSAEISDGEFNKLWTDLQTVINRIQSNKKAGCKTDYLQTFKSIEKRLLNWDDLEKYKLLLEATIHASKQREDMDGPDIWIEGSEEAVCGSTAHFQANVKERKVSFLSVSWKKLIKNESTPIDTSNKKFWCKTNKELFIESVCKEDEGEYQAVLSFEEDRIETTIRSNVICLRVVGGIPTVTTSHETCLQTQSVKLIGKVFVIDDLPVIDEIYWTKNEIKIDTQVNEEKYSKVSVDVPSLTIYNVNQYDAGRYRLTATNAAGTTVSDTIVLGAPDIVVGESKEESDGSQKFTVTITSIPAAYNIQWQVSENNSDTFTTLDENAEEYKGTSHSVPHFVLVVRLKEHLKNNKYQIEVQNFVGGRRKKIRILNIFYKDRGAGVMFAKLFNEVVELFPERKLNRLQDLIIDSCKDKDLPPLIKTATSAREYFRILKDKELFTPSDVIFMQFLLRESNCGLLNDKCIAYAKTQKALCFYEEPPRNGYRKVQFHVQGNISNYTTDQIGNIKETVVAIVGCDSEDIHLDGFLNSDSFFVVLSMKERYVNGLFNMNQQDKENLVNLNIDYFIIDSDHIYLKNPKAHRANTSQPLFRLMAAGLRVVRGPDWALEDSDGGEGHLGTVVDVREKDGMVGVAWDVGNTTTCRIGKDQKYDLRVFDNATIGIVFREKKCSECRAEPIYGMCWKCTSCDYVCICSVCYFRDRHSTDHAFTRYTTPNSEGVEVKKRFSSMSLRSLGMYPGAMVTRRKPDWEYGDQDGGDGTLGTVWDIRSFKKDMSHRNAVAVTWPSGKSYVYRVGYNGKMDLVCKEVARGFEYYREHLPVLDSSMIQDLPKMASTTRVKIGDEVCITLSVRELREAQRNFGGYQDEMESVIGKRGVIDGFTESGGILVKYQENRWVFNPITLCKIWHATVGETVRVKDEQQKVEALQKGHGEWNHNMAKVFGKVGRIARITPKKDVVVSFGRKHWVFNIACLRPCPGAEVDQIEEEDDLSLSIAHAGLTNGLGLLLEQLRILAAAQSTKFSPEKFLKLASDGNDKLVLQMVKGEPNLCNMRIKGTTALIVAAFEGRDDVVNVLLSNGAKPNLTDDNGNTALLASVSADKVSIVRILLQTGCDVNAANKDRRTAIHVAAKAGFEEAAKLLLANNCSVNVKDAAENTPLHEAIENSQDAIIVLLADAKGIDFRIVNKLGFNALIFAALKGNKTAANKVTAKCPELTDEPDSKSNNTALHVAAVNNRTEIATILLVQGRADTEKTNKDGRTPLHLASIEAYYDMVKILLDHNARVSPADNDGNTPMHCALGGSRSQPLILILMGHRVQTKTERVKIACMLLEFGAKLDQRNKKGQQAIDLAETDVKSAVQQHANDVSQRRNRSQGRQRPSSGRQEREMFKQEMVVPCFVCFRQTGSVTTAPCGHRCLCPNCSFQVEECPVCLQTIERRLDPQGKDVQILKLDDLCKVQ